MTEAISTEDAAIRAREWRNAYQAAICDRIEPWESGTVVRATSYRTYWDFNLVRVERDTGLGVAELIAFADEALAGLGHRRIDFDDTEAAERLRPEFEAAGWRTSSLVWMRHVRPVPPGPSLAVQEVPYDDAHELRLAWHRAEFPDHEPGDHPADARTISLARGARVLGVREAGRTIAFAQLERDEEGAEITHVYVDPGYRGGGRGTALTRAAIAAAGDPRDLWITADQEGRPKELYARLGFRPAWTSIEFLRLP